MTGSIVSAIVHSVSSRTASAHAPKTRESTEHSPLSPIAQRLGLITLEDLEREWTEAKEGWTGTGAPHTDTWWFCGVCDHIFTSIAGARKHMKGAKHRVLRGDWYDELAGLGPK